MVLRFLKRRARKSSPNGAKLTACSVLVFRYAARHGTWSTDNLLYSLYTVCVQTTYTMTLYFHTSCPQIIIKDADLDCMFWGCQIAIVLASTSREVPTILCLWLSRWSRFVAHGICICVWTPPVSTVMQEDQNSVFTQGESAKMSEEDDGMIYMTIDRQWRALRYIPVQLAVN